MFIEYSESFVFSGKRPVTVIDRFVSFHFVQDLRDRFRPFQPSITVTVIMYLIFHGLYTMNNYTTWATFFFKLINEKKILLKLISFEFFWNRSRSRWWTVTVTVMDGWNGLERSGNETKQSGTNGHGTVTFSAKNERFTVIILFEILLVKIKFELLV